MAATRIRGQEVEIRIVTDGELETSLTAIQNFELEVQLDTRDEGYLGETTNRKDDIFNGVRIRLALHLETQEWFSFQRRVIDRARRRTPATQFNVLAVLNFPNGDTPRVSIPDVSFGAQPLSVSSRGDYVTVTVEGQASDYDVLT